jgi:hypothetical protein
MKFIIFLAWLVGCLASCQPSSGLPDTFEASAIMISCKSIVIQIQDSDFYSYGEKGWRNPKDDKLYDHVFTVKNYCESIKKFPSHLAFNPWIDRAAVKLRIRIKDNASKGSCDICEPLLREPATEQNIKIIDIKW